jgi:hypothetical protein
MSGSNQNSGIVILVWNRAIVEEGISHYRIYLDGNVIGNTLSDTNSYEIIGLPFDVELTFVVVAVTNKCRVSSKSNEAKITLTNTNKQMLLNYSLDFFI